MINGEINKYRLGSDRTLRDGSLKETHPERKISLLILVLSLIFSGFFWLKTELKNNPQNLFRSYSFEFSKGEPASTLKNSGEVLNQIQKLISQLRGQYAVYIYAFNRQEAYGLNQDKIFPAASLNKVPIMLAFYKEIEKGSFSEETEYRLKEEDIQDYGTGSMRYEEPGKIYTYRELLRLAGKQSDNTAAYVIGKIVGLTKIQEFVDQLGLKQTSIEKNETSAEDLGKLFISVYKNELFRKEIYKNNFFADLKKTDFEDRLPAGFPSGTTVIHKIGNGERAYHDCGLVLAKNPFIICVLSQEAAEDEAQEVIPKIAKIVWDFEEK